MKSNEAIEKARAVIRRQHKSIGTESTYLGWLRRYMGAVRHMPAGISSEQKLERFLTELALKHDVSASTQNQAFNAICFFYKDVLGYPLQNVDALRATRPTRVRHAPTVKETRALLAAVKDVGGYPCNLITQLLYGCGLRVSEPLNLRIKDVELDGGKLFIMGGKGRKDRVVALPCALVDLIRGQMDHARAVWQRDKLAKLPLEVPHQLAKKYPEYQFAWPWAWLFPSRWPCKHPRTGELVRYRMHEANVQRAIKQARRQLGIMVLPHELRHAYATHSLDKGVNIKSLQEAMGHECVETTIGYCHADSLSVPSPLDGLVKT
jgi:integron integrase